MLKTSTYQQLRKDPTVAQEIRLIRMLKGLKRDGEITGSLCHGFKRGLGRLLYDSSRGVISTKDNVQKKEHHLSDVLRQNSYPMAFIRSSSQPPCQCVEGDRPPLVILPYTAGVSEYIRRVCRRYGT